MVTIFQSKLKRVFKIKNNKLFSYLRTFIFGFLEFDFSGNQSQKIQINKIVKELNEISRPITNSVIDITEKTKFTKDKIKTENDLHFCNLNEDESKVKFKTENDLHFCN